MKKIKKARKIKLVPKKKAKVVFSESATFKINSLVSGFNTEVAWHCITKRIEGERNAYYVEDVLVYPQEVTGVTVTADQEKYSMWLMEHSDDVFDNIRLQGHSHVNMSVNPSTIDKAFYKSIKDQLSKGMFYIFMIVNKRWEMYFEIVDDKTEDIFFTKDVIIEYEGFNPEKYLEECRNIVTKKEYKVSNSKLSYETKPVHSNKYRYDYMDSISNYYYDLWGFENEKEDQDDDNQCFSFLNEDYIPF